MKSDLSIEIAGIDFKNPLILASGILGVVPSSMLRLQEAGIGGVTTKSVGPRERFGYPNPSVIEIGPDAFLNSVGLANPGIDYFVDEIRHLKKTMEIPLIVSVFGDDAGGPNGFAEVAYKAQQAGADAIELNFSCPHAEVSSISLSPELTEKFTSAVRERVSIPIFAKLTPNIADMVPIARAAERGGADAVVVINTVRALALDIETGRPLLSHGMGGLSGKPIKPIGVRFVYELYPKISIPIIGVGGVFSWEDVIEYIYAGATAVQIGSCLAYGDGIIGEILGGLNKFLERKGVSRLSDLKGKSHDYKNELVEAPRE